MTTVARREQTKAWRMKIHTVEGGGGLRLHVREWGDPDGPPIVFIHGWSQNHLCWVKQYESALADEFRLVAYDLRGHGMSSAPLEAEHYADATLWADDVAAILDRLSSTGRCSWAGPTAPSSSATTFARTVRIVSCDQPRRGHGQAGRVFVRHADRPRLLDHFVDATADDLRPTSGPCAVRQDVPREAAPGR